MAGRLQDKVVVITGVGSGIGRDARAAGLFSEARARTCMADVDAEAGEATASACRDAAFQRVDVTDADSVSRMYETTAARFAGVDVLYTNARIMPADDDSSFVTGATFLVDGGITAAYVTPE